jgi:hypothetical protein
VSFGHKNVICAPSPADWLADLLAAFVDDDVGELAVAQYAFSDLLLEGRHAREFDREALMRIQETDRESEFLPDDLDREQEVRVVLEDHRRLVLSAEPVSEEKRREIYVGALFFGLDDLHVALLAGTPMGAGHPDLVR